MIVVSKSRPWLTALCFTLLTSLPALAAEVFVLSEEAPLLEAPQFNAKTLSQSLKGSALTVVSEQSNWLEVEYHGGTAWVSRWLVGTAPPQERVTHLDGELDSDEVRRRASSVATAGAIRGLSEGETELGGDTDFAELEQMESLTPNANELADFQQLLNQP